MQGVVRRYNQKIYSNRIEQIEQHIKRNQYSDELEDDELFFLNKPTKLGDGSDKNHLSIMKSSKNMMSKCENTGVFHIDGTYKLIKNRFPVMGNSKNDKIL